MSLPDPNHADTPASVYLIFSTGKQKILIARGQRYSTRVLVSYDAKLGSISDIIFDPLSTHC